MRILALLLLCHAATAGAQTLVIDDPNQAQDHKVIDTGIFVPTGQKLTLTNCYLAVKQYGVVVAAGASLEMSNCWGSYFGAPYDGSGQDSAFVFVSGGASSVNITHCKFVGPIAQGVTVRGTVNGYLNVSNNVFRDNATAIQFAGARNLPSAWICWNIVAETDNSNFYHWDRFSTFDSCGVPGNPIRYYHNLIAASIHYGWFPDEAGDSGIQCGDSNTSYVDAEYNTVLNISMGSYYSCGDTTLLKGNVVIGMSPSWVSAGGIGCVQPGSGIEEGNYAAFWNSNGPYLLDYHPAAQPGNYTGGASDISLAAEQQAVQSWIQQLLGAGQYVGPADDYDALWIGYPQASDFQGVQ